MCGIAAFQLAPGSKINARALAHALLSQIEWRGTDASGFAYATRDGRTGIYKDHVIGSQLKLKGMPKDADTVILHTRMATHGTHMDNDNNHPVSGPEDRIRLVPRPGDCCRCPCVCRESPCECARSPCQHRGAFP